MEQYLLLFSLWLHSVHQNNMNTFNKQKNRNGGFTIIEALVAIFILSISVASMLGVTATSASYARYSNNEITANYLLQEAVDSVRNSRDTIAFQKKDEYAVEGDAWKAFLNRYGWNNGTVLMKCFSSEGCILKIEEFDATNTSGNDVAICPSSGCPMINYDESLSSKLFYNYTTGNESIFKRVVKMELVNPDEVKIVATVEWFNVSGVSTKRTQTLEINLLNWQN